MIKRSIEKIMEGRLCIRVPLKSTKGLRKTDLKEHIHTEEEDP